MEPHVRQVTEQHHIDYQFCGLEDDDGEGGEIAYDPNKDVELSFDYRANEKEFDITSASRNSMEVRFLCYCKFINSFLKLPLL